MNFFEHQSQAHRESKKLLFLFIIAVICIVLAVNATLALIWLWMMKDATGHTSPYPNGFFYTNTFITILFIGGGTLIEMLRLRDGGEVIAQMAGGRLVQPNSRDRHERRLLNIVEEMAIASGIACPRVYIMDKEDAINAFAAGYHQNEAVVAVTRGTLTRLNRDELQGVIGHEFSHILNGDMRMNVKLIGVLFGIQMLAEFGRYLMESSARIGSSRSNEKGLSIQVVLLVSGATFFAIGYIGIFFGRLIKSAVSRQREFLADASAVQFTRNPDGIGGALRKIGGLTKTNQCGSRINDIHAEQFSHMFLGAVKASFLSGFFATHPPISKRLEKIYGRNVALLNADELSEDAYPPEHNEAMIGFAPLAPSLAVDAIAPPISVSAFDPTIGYKEKIESQSVKNNIEKRSITHDLPSDILIALRNPLGACELVWALLINKNDLQAYHVQQLLLNQAVRQHAFHALKLHKALEPLPQSLNMPLLDLAMPALKLLTSDQRQYLLGISSRLIAADNKVSQSEFIMQTVLHRRLSSQSGRAIPVRYNSLTELKTEIALVLSLIVGTAQNEQVAKALFVQAIGTNVDLGLTESNLVNHEEISYFDVKQALDKLNQLAPLAKPFLIRLLMSAVSYPINLPAADLLRCACAAIDAPVPEAVSATYDVEHWNLKLA